MVDTKRFISIEGIEGTGKSTMLKLIQACFHKRGLSVLMTREPGGTPVAEAVRHVLLGQWHNDTLIDEVELMLMFASRKQHVEGLIKPHLQQGDWVVSDRFVDASYAYQGGGRGIDSKRIDGLSQWTLGDFKPGLTLLLDCPVDVALSRIAHRGKDRIEHEQAAFFEKVRACYLELAKKEPSRYQIIDVSMPLDVVEKEVHQAIDTYVDKNRDF